MYVAIFGAVWGVITEMLGVGWFSGGVLVGGIVNVVPIMAVAGAKAL